MKSFSEPAGKEKIIELLRWTCVPAAAVLGVLALGMLTGVVRPPVPARPLGSPPLPVSDFHRYYLPWTIGSLMAAAFVLAGAKTAPRYRPATAIVLAILWMLYAFLNHVFVHLGRGAPHYAHFVVAIVAAAGGVAYVFYSERPKGGRQ